MKVIFVFLLLIFLTTIFPQDEFYGVKFHSKNKPEFERSSIYLNDNKPISLKNDFSISFDISFWSLAYYGPIFRANHSDKEFIRFVFNQFADNENYLLQLFLQGLSNPLLIKLDRKSFTVNKWINVKISFDAKKDQVTLYLNNRAVDSTYYRIPDEIKIKMYFGLYDYSDNMDLDLAAIYLKNILIEESDKKKFFWHLNPFEKDNNYDKISGQKIILKNTDWVIKDHYYWNKKYEANVNNYPLFAHDSVNSRIFIDDKNRLIIFNLQDFKDSVIYYKNHRPGKWHNLFYDSFRNRLYSTFTALGPVSIYEFGTNEWTTIDTSKEENGHYYGSVRFINPADSLIYSFGGYGWYTAKDNLFQYDFMTGYWKEIKLDNNIGYRFNVSIFKGFDSRHYLFWGGKGNYTGKQEEGFQLFNDLYSFDLVNKEFTKIWEYKNGNLFRKYNFLLSNAFLSKDDSTFYFLMNSDTPEKKYYHLFKADLKNSIISRIGDEISFDTDRTMRSEFFCYDSKTQEFILVKQALDSSKVFIYGLKFPPVQQTEIASIVQPRETEKQFPFIIIVLSSVALLTLGYLLMIKRKRKSQSNSEIIIPVDKKQSSKNSIKTFGGFFIYDRDGNEISNNLSPKLKEIFLLILIKSFNNHRGGITSEELSSIIWPDSSPESAKSNRGVAINKIRKFLSNVEGITIEFSDKLWFIEIDNGAKCDYAEYLKLYSSFKAGKILNGSSVDYILNVFDGGEFLKGISYEWLESIKFAINNEVIGFLKSFFDHQEIKSKPEKIIRICDTILKFDCVEQDAVKIKIKTLIEMGKVHNAKSSFHLFVADYKKLYDENFPLSFEGFISS